MTGRRITSTVQPRVQARGRWPPAVNPLSRAADHALDDPDSLWPGEPQLRIRPAFPIALLALVAGGCGDEVLGLAPEAHPLADNLFIARGPAGTIAPLGGAIGSFSLTERCLTLEIDGQRRTPVFAGQVGIERDGLVVRGRKIRFRTEVRLTSLDGPYRVSQQRNRACPAEAVFLRAID
jgi:hypothetical protein